MRTPILLASVVLAISPLIIRAQQVPSFGNYPAKVVRINRKVQPLIRSTPYTVCYRTMLRNTVKGGELFAGHFLIDSVGCGSECLRLGIVDMHTGRSYVSPFFVHMGGVKWRQDSRLLIVNSPDLIRENFGAGPLPERFRPEYYLWDGRRLRLIDGGRVLGEPEPIFKTCKDIKPPN